MKKLGVVITDGVGFRNFIMSDFIVKSREEFAEVVIYSCLPSSAFNGYETKCNIVELAQYTESRAAWFFRKAKEVAHLRLHKENNFGIADNHHNNKSKSKSIRGYMIRFIYLITEFLHSESWILRYNALQVLFFKKSNLSKSFRTQLLKDKVDLLFFTHQRPPFIAPLIHEAQQLNIKTTAFIFSWDNLASKGRMAGNFDYYLVWSELMKSDLLKFYTSVKPEQIQIVGTPQFEPYVLSRYQSSKDAFNKQFDLKDNLPVILFTCNDSSSVNDPYYLEILASYIAEEKLKAQLIVRTSPADVPARFLYLKDKYPFIHWNFPEWILTRENHAEPWTQRIPSFNDVLTLRALLEFSDLVINVLSTITIDSFLFDKPVICPVFALESRGISDIFKFLDYAHLKHVDDSNSVAMIKDEKEFLPSILDAIQNPTKRIMDQKQLLALEIGKPIEGTSERIAKCLASI